MSGFELEAGQKEQKLSQVQEKLVQEQYDFFSKYPEIFKETAEILLEVAKQGVKGFTEVKQLDRIYDCMSALFVFVSKALDHIRSFEASEKELTTDQYYKKQGGLVPAIKSAIMPLLVTELKKQALNELTPAEMPTACLFMLYFFRADINDTVNGMLEEKQGLDEEIETLSEDTAKLKQAYDRRLNITMSIMGLNTVRDAVDRAFSDDKTYTEKKSQLVSRGSKERLTFKDRYFELKKPGHKRTFAMSLTSNRRHRRGLPMTFDQVTEACLYNQVRVEREKAKTEAFTKYSETSSNQPPSAAKKSLNLKPPPLSLVYIELWMERVAFLIKITAYVGALMALGLLGSNLAIISFYILGASAFLLLTLISLRIYCELAARKQEGLIAAWISEQKAQELVLSAQLQQNRIEQKQEDLVVSEKQEISPIAKHFEMLKLALSQKKQKEVPEEEIGEVPQSVAMELV